MSEPIRPSAQLSLAAAFAAFAGTFGLARLVHPGVWIAECLLLSLAVAASGYLLRTGLRGRGGALRLSVLAGQAVAGALVFVALFAHSAAKLGFIPWPGTLAAVNQVLNAGGHDIRTSVPPAPATQGISAILCLVCLGLALLIDALAATFHRAVLAGLPLLAIFLVPATRLPGGLSWLDFAATSTGYLVLIGVEGQGRLMRWGHPAPVPGRTQAPGARADRAARAGTHQPLAARITVTSLLVALILPVFVPTFPNVLKQIGSGSGGTGPSGSAYSLSTDVDLRSSLNSSTPVPLFQYTSTAPDVNEEYLGTSVLDQFDGNTWKASGQVSRQVTENASAQIPGLNLTGVAQTPVTTKITVVGEYSFGPIPTPYATESISGVGYQLAQPATLGYDTSGPPATRQSLTYTSNSIDVVPTVAQLEGVGPADKTTFAQYLQLPSTLPADVTAMAESITAGDSTPYTKALALQNYFLQNFTYSLQVPYGESNSAIDDFLSQKVGFCQQFAATMAVMARALGIPAVVDVGYTPGDKGASGAYQVTSHDAHSWPMLYFTGVGWVRFEPTPDASTAEGSQPAWAPIGGVGSSASSVPSVGATASAAPRPTGSACVPSPNSRLRGLCDTPSDGPAASKPFSSWGPFGVVPREFKRLFLTGGYPLITLKLLLLLFVLVCGFPAYTRLTRRRKRRQLVRKLNREISRSRDGSSAGQPFAAGEPGQAGPADGLASARSTNRSLFAQTVQAAWAELRENAADLGYPWDDSDTPRQAAERLSREADLDEAGYAAVLRITGLAERAWYAPADSPAGPADTAAEDQIRQLSRDLDTVRGGLAANSTRSVRLRAALLPASSLQRMRQRRERFSTSAYLFLHPRRAAEEASAQTSDDGRLDSDRDPGEMFQSIGRK
ncbi:MAG TPA: DUF3488 and transglutaminase-like domain-containing protein [Actinocrinis sp.]|nr:DUF3488 and transglutaminase-like domain-containing protein [Actinocrinis sp.]